MTPLETFLRQVERFNAHDLEGFLATYAADAYLHHAPGEPIVGHAAMRAQYAPRFADRSLACRALSAVAFGDHWLVAHERITSAAGEALVVATFEVRDGLITRVSSMR